MSVLIEDSPRNLLKWITGAIKNGTAQGAVLTPWSSPLNGRTYRRSVADHSRAIQDEGGDVWFNPSTHVLQMANVGDFRYYEEYDLWAGPRGDLTTQSHRIGHIRKVFAVQRALGTKPLGPTILLHHSESETSQHALDLAKETIEEDPDSWLSIAGTSPFWTSGTALDAHVGALAQLRPRGWFLTVARPLSSLPVEAHADEVYGLCRTVRALSEYSPVHISHGDLAALPAIAAGAESVGTGWDQGQRACAFTTYGPRGDGQGRWYDRPTFPGLLGSLKKNEAELLQRVDPARANRLGPVPPPGPQEAYRHHLHVLTQLATQIKGSRTYEERYRTLANLYTQARAEWPDVVRITNCEHNEASWIADLSSGLAAYALDEGW